VRELVCTWQGKGKKQVWAGDKKSAMTLRWEDGRSSGGSQRIYPLISAGAKISTCLIQILDSLDTVSQLDTQTRA
jgi:hypothetical protein